MGNPLIKPNILSRKIVEPIKISSNSRSTDKLNEGRVTFSAKNNKPIKNNDVGLPLNHCSIKLFNPSRENLSISGLKRNEIKVL